MTVGIALTRKAGGLAKNRVRVCAQELMLAFPQHCIVSREGGSSVFFMGTDSVQSRMLSLKANDLESEKVALNKRRGRKSNRSKPGENNSLREMKHGRCKRGSKGANQRNSRIAKPSLLRGGIKICSHYLAYNTSPAK